MIWGTWGNGAHKAQGTLGMTARRARGTWGMRAHRVGGTWGTRGSKARYTWSTRAHRARNLADSLWTLNLGCPILLLEEITEKTIEVIKVLRVKCIHVINITDTTLMADNNRCLLVRGTITVLGDQWIQNIWNKIGTKDKKIKKSFSQVF